VKSIRARLARVRIADQDLEFVVDFGSGSGIPSNHRGSFDHVIVPQRT